MVNDALKTRSYLITGVRVRFQRESGKSAKKHGFAISDTCPSSIGTEQKATWYWIEIYPLDHKKMS